MAEVSNSDQREGLNEVLSGIEDAMKRLFKDKDGKSYCHVSTALLREWMMTVENATRAAAEDDALRGAYAKAKESVVVLLKAAEARETEQQRLLKAIETHREAAEATKANYDVTLKELKSKLEDTKTRLQEAVEFKASYASTMRDLERRLTGPEAKFDPDLAAAAKKEADELRADLASADSELAECRANIRALNVQIDETHKKVAAKNKELEEAKIKLSVFQKQLGAAKHLNVDLFTKDDYNRDDLRLALGDKAFRKLENVIAVQSWDVRGRVQALMGFFTTYAVGAKVKAKAMLGLLKIALEKLRDKAGSWAVVLAPWVNMVLKDIVFMNIRHPREYRQALEARLASVNAIGPGKSVKEKRRAMIEAHPVKPEDGWRARGKERVRQARATLNTWRERVNERWVMLKSIAVSLSAVTWGKVKSLAGATAEAAGSVARGTKAFGLKVYQTICVVLGISELPATPKLGSTPSDDTGPS